MKKRILSLIAVVVLPSIPLTFTTGCAVGEIFACMGKESLKVFNWGEYIDMSTIREFEKENKVCVSYPRFETPESALIKMESQTYDVVFLSDYAVEQLAQEQKIVELDWSKLGIEFSEFNEQMMQVINQNNIGVGSQDFNLLKYSAPYMWGELGMVYNKDKVTLAELEAKGWEVMRDKKYRVAYYDSPRDGFIPPLSQLGYSFSTVNATEVNAAKDWLLEQKSALGNNISYITDQILTDMASLKYDIGFAYSGDAITIMSEQSKIGYYRPADKKTNVFVDAIVIPKKSNKTELAHKFIAKMMEKDIAYANSAHIGYTSSRQDVTEELVADEFADYAEVYDLRANQLDEIFRYIKENKTLINAAWDQVRSS